jgi:hypothetical protein
VTMQNGHFQDRSSMEKLPTKSSKQQDTGWEPFTTSEETIEQESRTLGKISRNYE